MINLDGKKAYATDEAAAIIGMEACYIRKRIRDGAIKALKINGRYYITADSLLEYQRKKEGAYK